MRRNIMSKFTSEMVDDYADKLLIGLTKEENKMVLDEFEIIDSNIDIINEIPNIEKVEPMTHCLDDFEYELREDVKEESVPIEELLQNCDLYTDREVEVPKVVD
jgi:aspartyl/glutamyl-tRNA(Asn/Gln) amidotransferase C subunit